MVPRGDDLKAPLFKLHFVHQPIIGLIVSAMQVDDTNYLKAFFMQEPLCNSHFQALSGSDGGF